MEIHEVLIDGFGRVQEAVHRVLEGLDGQGDGRRASVGPAALGHRPVRADGGRGNSIAWLVWHLTRVQDDHLADAFDVEQEWTSQGWAERFGLPLPLSDTGYGHSTAEVAAVVAGAADLRGYHDAVHRRTVEHLRSVTSEGLDRVVDEAWDPPVTLGVRLVSVLDDDLEHVGQAAYVRGLLGLTT
jgi:hypothetical protein